MYSVLYTSASSKARGGSSIFGKAYIAPLTLRQLTPGIALNFLYTNSAFLRSATCVFALSWGRCVCVCETEREGGREREREREREGGRKGGREEGREGGRERGLTSLYRSYEGLPLSGG